MAGIKIKAEAGTGSTELQGPANTNNNTTLKLPSADGSANQLLKTDGSGNLGWATDTNTSGISNASVWRVNTNFTLTSSTSTITDNWEADDSYLAGSLGSAMTQSSGVFTFPSTGIWKVEMHLVWWVGTSTAYQALTIESTPDNGTTWNGQAHGYTHKSYNNSRDDYTTTSVTAILDITDTSNSKIRFVENTSSGATAYCRSADNSTYAVFMKLGDT